MILFLDSSALVELGVVGDRRELVLAALTNSPARCASALARTEAMLALRQLALGPHELTELWAEFRSAWDSLHVVPVDGPCLDRAVEVGSTFSLGISDAVHLAAADRLPRPVRYLTFSPSQIPAAAELGFEVISEYGG